VRGPILALALGAALLAPGAALAKKRALGPGERIDLNRASAAELMRLPGIGRGRAEAIVAHRQKRPFQSPGEVVQVKGIGPAWLEKNRAHLTAGEALPRPRVPPGS
jgi:competence protein ComEA